MAKPPSVKRRKRRVPRPTASKAGAVRLPSAERRRVPPPRLPSKVDDEEPMSSEVLFWWHGADAPAHKHGRTESIPEDEAIELEAEGLGQVLGPNVTGLTVKPLEPLKPAGQRLDYSTREMRAEKRGKH